MSETLLKEVIEELWGSFGYGSPEAHAPVLIKMISRGIIQEFLDVRDRIITAMKLRYGEYAKGNKYLENIFKKELEKLEKIT
ncbi:hypothetical protein LCGC14_1625190 [marine sediment metagenome]|uniref:Uncharacterized protein n=1 Tax=marine sediment metagenome TaxID=412755 RepID=A0A0F9I4H0_9ZZZZ